MARFWKILVEDFGAFFSGLCLPSDFACAEVVVFVMLLIPFTLFVFVFVRSFTLFFSFLFFFFIVQMLNGHQWTVRIGNVCHNQRSFQLVLCDVETILGNLFFLFGKKGRNRSWDVGSLRISIFFALFNNTSRRNRNSWCLGPTDIVHS